MDSSQFTQTPLTENSKQGLTGLTRMALPPVQRVAEAYDTQSTRIELRPLFAFPPIAAFRKTFVAQSPEWFLEPLVLLR